ncbi:putative enoyl-CoA hydratase paaG [Mycobacterium avium subsp. avium 2285 (R)]|nr:putative enoyl-CoA hydratase paaG [Mycobacterium avium subsp. avium 2285 (R)]
MVRAITEIPKPVVAGVRGAASGVGCALALACDLVVAARSAFFHFAFTRVGLMPDGGTSTLLAATIGRARAARVVLMAERLPAQQAFDWGMISHVVDDDDYDTELAAVVGALATGPTEAYGLSKQALRASTLSTLPHVQALEAGGQRSLAGTEYFRRAASAFRNRSRPEAPVATSHSKSKDHI